jgi:hypothetical protein
VQGIGRDGFGAESGAKLIDQRGIDFVPTEDFLQGLGTAGANEAFPARVRIFAVDVRYVTRYDRK